MSERLDRLNRECYGMRYLRNVIRSAIKWSDSNSETIMVDDGEDKHFYPMTESGVKDACRWALEIDGQIVIRVHRAAFVVLYDGPYDNNNKAEIIMDGNMRSNEIINTLDENGRNLADGGIHRIL